MIIRSLIWPRRPIPTAYRKADIQGTRDAVLTVRFDKKVAMEVNKKKRKAILGFYNMTVSVR